MTPKTTKPLLSNQDYYKALPFKDEITPAEHRLILKVFFYLLGEAIIKTHAPHKIPFTIGTIGVFGSRTKKKELNYQLYKETGVKANINNFHSTRKVFQIKMKKPKIDNYTYRIRGMYDFKATRTFQRRLAAHLKSTNSNHHLYHDNATSFY